MPSRLPPGLPIGSLNSNGSQITQLPLGSLALLSPDSAFPPHIYPPVQTSPSSSSTARLNPSLHPSASNLSLNYPQHIHQQQRFGLHSQASSSTSSLPIASNSVEQPIQSFENYRADTAFNLPPQINQQNPIQQQAAANASVSRLRSGSLSVLSDGRPSVYPSPFGSSIWSSQRNSHLPTPAVDSSRTSQTSLLNALEKGQSPNANPSPSHMSSDLYQQASSGLEIDPQTIDPLQPFYKELTMRTDPSRMRSYTVNNLPFNLLPHDSLNGDSLNDYSDQPSQRQQPTQYSQPNQMPPSSQIPGHVPEQSQQQRASSFLGGNRPRAQTTAGSFEPPFTMGNAAILRSAMAPKTTQSGLYITAQDPLSENIIINSFDDTSIGPTRSLWLGNIPAATTSYALNAIFSSYGTVESARVLPHKNCGFVNFLNIESAVQAKSVLHGKELFTGYGPCRVGFAKVVDSSEFEASQVFPQDTSSNGVKSQVETPSSLAESSLSQDASPIGSQSGTVSETATRTSSVEYAATDKEVLPEPANIETTKTLEEIAGEMGVIVMDLGATPEERDHILASVNRALEFKSFKTDIPPVPEPRPDRIYDAPTLREVRKKIDSGNCSQEEIEEIALQILDEIAELSSDYVGNTVVQKLFDSCSEPIKDMMLEEIAPHLAQISVHKNGTWAAQKIIGVAGSKRQIDAIAQALHPYTVHLFLDQFGNYAIQCCLKFGTPWNDFIFETMLSQFWDIAQGRFGARAMRACLESHHVSREQQCMLAAAITTHAVQLATNANGALLLTWYLDTYTAANRHSILAPKLIPNLVQLCTHKLASLTVLKVINYKAEPSARQKIFAALFSPFSDAPSAVLEQILNHSYGPTFIYKVISTPFFEGQERQNAINKIRSVLVAIKAQPAQGYKRLMDEVGLSTRATAQPATISQTNLGRANSTASNRTYHNQQSQSHSMRPQMTLQRARSTGGHGSGYFSQSQVQAQPQVSQSQPIEMPSSMLPPQQNKSYNGRGNNNSPNYVSQRGFYNESMNEPMMQSMYKPVNMFGQMPPPLNSSPGSQYDANSVQQQFDQLSIGEHGVSPNKFQDQQQYGFPPWQQQQPSPGFFDPQQTSPNMSYSQPQQYYEKH